MQAARACSQMVCRKLVISHVADVLVYGIAELIYTHSREIAVGHKHHVSVGGFFHRNVNNVGTLFCRRCNGFGGIFGELVGVGGIRNANQLAVGLFEFVINRFTLCFAVALITVRGKRKSRKSKRKTDRQNETYQLFCKTFLHNYISEKALKLFFSVIL